MTPGRARGEVPTPPAGQADAPTEPAAVAASGAGVVNAANALTGLRLLLVPVFTVLLFAHGGDRTGWRAAACLVFAVASFTDRVDGALARRRGLVTEFGTLADPIADKALTGTALVGLSLLGELSWAVTGVVLVREIGVTALRLWVIRHGVMPASRGGKVKTLLLGVAIGLYVLPLAGPLATARAVVMAVAVVVALVTGVDYVARALALRRTGAKGATDAC